jgi:hypothetical protein
VAATGVRGYSPPPPAVSPVRGLIDFHTHAAPDVFGRAVNDEELAAFAAARQMEAVVFKNHVTSTADRAWLARKHVGGVKIFGGVVLNAAVGGINPQAVEWMWRMQGGHGRVVWFPTFDADNHVRRAGTAPAGIRVVDERGAVAQFDVVSMTEAHMRKAASMGAKLELCALGMLVGPEAPLEWMRHTQRVPLPETAARLRSVGAHHFVLGTDLGQTGNPTPPDGLQTFVSGLLAEGLSRAQIETMGRGVPGALLMG